MIFIELDLSIVFGSNIGSKIDFKILNNNIKYTTFLFCLSKKYASKSKYEVHNFLSFNLKYSSKIIGLILI